jgi:hypothetical protein
MGLVFGLMFWMVRTGKLDFTQLKVIRDHPEILLANVLLWGGGYLALCGFRWFLLLKGLGINMKYRRICTLQLIGFFFNTAIPGAVGGDIIKALYVIREQEGDRKTPAMLTILLDRIVGLSALFFMAALSICSQLAFFISRPELFVIALFALGGSVAVLLGVAWVFLVKEDRDPIAWLLAYNFPGSRIVRGMYEALRTYRHHPRYLASAFGISVVVQCGALFNARELTFILTGVNPELAIFSTIFPLGVMTTALPLAPGGLGVGHVAFDKLFSLVGLSGGANVFNVMVLVQLALNLTGIVPYLLYRREGALPDKIQDSINVASPL